MRWHVRDRRLATRYIVWQSERTKRLADPRTVVEHTRGQARGFCRTDTFTGSRKHPSLELNWIDGECTHVCRRARRGAAATEGERTRRGGRCRGGWRRWRCRRRLHGCRWREAGNMRGGGGRWCASRSGKTQSQRSRKKEGQDDTRTCPSSTISRYINGTIALAPNPPGPSPPLLSSSLPPPQNPSTSTTPSQPWIPSCPRANPSTHASADTVTSTSRPPPPASPQRPCAMRSATSSSPSATPRPRVYVFLTSHLLRCPLICPCPHHQAFDTEMQSFFHLFTRYLAERAKSQDL